jgi:predicted glycoside hydrolase/deacetylase ChbG (UPF0249 family)
MPVGRAFDQAARLAREAPGLDIGIHLTLVEERPLLPAHQLPSLVGSEGRLLPHADRFVLRYLAGRIALAEVRRELAEQCRRVLDAGLSPSHVDSHQHLHLLPRLLEVVLELCREFGIPTIRLVHEPRVVRQVGRTPPARIGQALILNALSRRARLRQRSGVDGFLGFLCAGRLDERELLRLLEHLPNHGTWELGCHPGLPDGETPYPHWGYHWESALAALTSPRVRALVEQRGIRLVGFRHLVDSPQAAH